ncbi:MAG: terpene cyclase/mutase family protein [Planctomycetes bacterium]|nr:terpene cyclase/mutase family protein [Planctomycetota bacterium]
MQSRRPLSLLACLVAAALAGGLVLFQGGSGPGPSRGKERVSPEAAARAGARALERKVSHEDGGWHSETYGILRPGRALTPFALHAIARSGRTIDPGVLARAIAFLDGKTTEAGAIAAGGGVLDYPNYATALAVLALVDLRCRGWESRVRRMVDYLLADQLADPLGWTPADAAYGGWGFGGSPRSRPTVGPPTVNPDLSVTALVLSALGAGGVARDHPARGRALAFALRCQELGSNGGFIFNPVDLSNNKAGPPGADGVRVRVLPYATATTDGLYVLLACGLGPRDSPVAAAIRWLGAHPSLDAPEGFEAPGPPRWDLGLRFYYWWSAARAMRALEAAGGRALLPWPDWREQISRRVLDLARPDGTWSNPVALSREDDPLVATPFAILTLDLCHK